MGSSFVFQTPPLDDPRGRTERLINSQFFHGATAPNARVFAGERTAYLAFPASYRKT